MIENDYIIVINQINNAGNFKYIDLPFDKDRNKFIITAAFYVNVEMFYCSGKLLVIIIHKQLEDVNSK